MVRSPARTLVSAAVRLPALLPALALAALLQSGCGHPAATQVDVLTLSDTTDTAGPYVLTVAIRTSARIVRAELRWWNDNGTARPVPLEREGGDRWKGSIPGHPAGAVLHYVVAVEDDEGNRLQLPAPGGDADAYTFRVTGG